MIDEGLARRLLNRRELERVLARNRPCRGAARLAAVLGDEDAMTITRSEREKAFLKLIRQSGLPVPETNVKFGPYEPDFLWRRERLIVELDSPTFHAGPARLSERPREGPGLSGGAASMSCGSPREHVVHEPAMVLVMVAQELARAGGRLASRSRRSVSSSLPRRIVSCSSGGVSGSGASGAALECILIVSSTSAGLTRPNGTAGGSSGTTRSNNSAAETRRRGRRPGVATWARLGRHGSGVRGHGPGRRHGRGFGHGRAGSSARGRRLRARLGRRGAGRRRGGGGLRAFAGAVAGGAVAAAVRLTAAARTAFFLQPAWVCAPRGAGAPRASAA